jgi:hypothetical protein
MKKLILFILLIAGTHAYSQQHDAEKVNQLHKKKFQWMVTKNYDSLNWVTDQTLKFIHSNGWIQSKKDLVEDLKSGKLNYTSIVVQESSVSVYNNKSAVVTGKGTFKGLMPDQSEFNVYLLYTEVYVKSKKQWKLISRHACKI